MIVNDFHCKQAVIFIAPFESVSAHFESINKENSLVFSKIKSIHSLIMW